MAAGQLDVTIIRRALEGRLSPSATSAVLFDALSAFGRDIPQTAGELKRLVRGPLAAAINKRLGEPESAEIVRRILDQLEGSDPEILIMRGDSEPPPAPPAGTGPEATAAVPTARAPVPVAVIADGAGFAARLATALGPRRVAPRAVRRLDELRSPSAIPSIVLVDATDFAAIEPNDLAQALARLPGTTAHVVWAADLPYGRGVLAAMQDANVPSVPLGREEGIEPLLDLIRSRRTVDPGH